MIATTASTRVLARTFRVLLVLETLAFLCFALLHLGVRIPLGFAVLQEPQRPYAVIVEGVAAILLALAATAAFTRRTWAWAAATAAHAVALAGVLWGMIAIAAGRGPHTQLNDTFHRRHGLGPRRGPDPAADTPWTGCTGPRQARLRSQPGVGQGTHTGSGLDELTEREW
jgi:hypothetical protein